MKKRSFTVATVSLVLIFSFIFATGCANKKEPLASDETTTVEQITHNNVELTSEKFSEPDITLYETTTAVEIQEETTTSVTPETVEDIVDFFNESANRIKPEAKKVVKNFEKRIVNEDRLVIPALLENTARNMMKTLMKDDTDPIVYETRDDITNEFLVPEQSYVSKLKPEAVKSAECKDNGEELVITIKLKDQINPTAGVGVGAVCDVIETGEVAEKASFVEKFTTEYYNCEITAKINKESGRVTHIVYTTPVALELTVNMFGTHSGAVGFTFVKDYSVAY